MQWTDSEIVVVGGGIMGVTTAFYLRRLGHEVTLIERKGIGEEASGRNAGSLSMQNKPFPLIPLAKGGMEVWKELDTELGGLGLKQSGGFRVGETEEDLEKLRVALEVQNKHGLNVRHLSPGEIQDAAPYLSPSLAGANFCPTDGFVDALTATKQIADRSQREGLKILTHTEVTQIEAEDGEVRIWTSADGGFRCQRVVVATSAWTRKLVSSLGLDLPINLSIFQLIVTPRLSPFIHHIITHVKGHLTVKQLGVGSVLIGGGWRGKGNLERDRKLVNYDSILGNVYVAAKVIPKLANTVAIRMWSGFDGRTVDELPLVGPLPGMENVLLAGNGFGGFTIGPYVGKLLAQKMHTGKSEVSLEPFSPARYF